MINESVHLPEESSNEINLVLSNENYLLRSYGDVIVVNKIPTRRTSQAQSIVMYKTKNILNNINKINRLTNGSV